MDKICFFTGHRRLSRDKDYVRRLLESAVLDAINDGVDTFIAGGAVGFDMLAAQSVLTLRHDYEISLRLYIPYRGHTSGWHEEDREEFVELLPKADSVLYVSENYFRGCMRKRNEAMVRDSDCGIAWCERGASGTLQTVSIAKKRGIVVRNIYSEYGSPPGLFLQMR